MSNNEGPVKTHTGQIVSTLNDMAHPLNTYFSLVITNEQLNNIPQLSRCVVNTLDTNNFRIEEIQEKIKHLSIYKSTGPDLLPSILLTLEDML